MSKPFIFLAFADSQNDLPQLKEERRELEDLLDRHFDVKSRDKVTRNRINDNLEGSGHVMQIFHFGGHANQKAIKLVSSDGEDSLAYVKGVAGSIGKYSDTVKLVFLNGCSTEGQVKSFIKANVPVVIATLKPVGDEVARRFSTAFYRSLTGNQGKVSIGEAFEEAKNQLYSYYPTTSKMLSRAVEDPEDERDDVDFPYTITGTPEAQAVTFADMCRTPESFQGGHKQSSAEAQKSSIPPKAFLLVDRDEPSVGFEAYVEQTLKPGEPHSPLACLVHGPEVEEPLKLCERFQTYSVKSIFRLPDENYYDSLITKRTIDMPSAAMLKRKGKGMQRVRESLLTALMGEDSPSASANKELTASRILQSIDPHQEAIVLQHHFQQTSLDGKDGIEFLAEYLDFWNISLTAGQPFVLLLFSMESTSRNRLLSMLRPGQSGIVTSFQQRHPEGVLKSLEQVRYEDVRDWNNRYAKDYSGLTQEIFQDKKKLSMRVILPRLESVINARRTF